MLTKVLGLICAGVFLGAAIFEIKKRRRSEKQRTPRGTTPRIEVATGDASADRTAG